MNKEIKHIRVAMIFFSIGLFISGITAFPLLWEVSLLQRIMDPTSMLGQWIAQVHEGLLIIDQYFQYLAYGTDWLAFAHLLFALLFLGASFNPVKNKWTVEFGIISCIFIFPLAFIAGEIRSIPIFWRLIDCCFGLIGLLPLLYAYRKIKKIENNSYFQTKSSNHGR